MTRVLVFVNDFTSTSIPVEIATKVQTETQTEIILVSYYNKSDDELDPDLQELDIPMICLGASSRVDIKAYRELRQLCIHQDIDVIHTHHNSVGSLGRLAVTKTNTKIVNTEHNDHQYFSHLQKGVNAITYPLIDVMVHNSRNTQDSLSWYEKVLSRLSFHEVIYNGIDASRIDDTDSPPISIPDGPIVTTAGRLVDQKNHATLLRAFERVLEQHPETTLVIVGDGPLSDDLKSIAKELGIQDSVVFTGYLPRREDVYSVLKQSTIAVFSSWYEGFCVAAVEAMAAGLPIVVSDIEVLHEVVGDPGIFADPNDPVGFAEAISDVLQHPQKRERLAHEAKDRARSKFSLKRTAHRYSKVYNEVAERSNR
jgi:glycosyltransferase involved in cell wall biosynthesis